MILIIGEYWYEIPVSLIIILSLLALILPITVFHSENYKDK
jgi:hypothetical protein